jgi:hypothetical protein
MDAIEALHLQAWGMDILRVTRDLMKIKWGDEEDYESVKRDTEQMNSVVQKQKEKCKDDMELLESQHYALYDALYGVGGTKLCVTFEVRNITRCIFQYTLRAREGKYVGIMRDAMAEDLTAHQRRSGQKQLPVNTSMLYEEVMPTKYLPIVELKDKGRVVNKLYRNLLTSAMRSVGRIDKQMKTAMLAYTAILMGAGLHYTKVIFPSNTTFCHSVIEGYGKDCSASYFDKYAQVVRDMNKHLTSVRLEGYTMTSSRRKVMVRGLEGIPIHLLCDAVMMTTECITDVLYIRELNRVLEQSITLFMELKFPLEQHIASTLSFRTAGGVVSECTLMVKGGPKMFTHVMGYVERLMCVLKMKVISTTTSLYKAFENSGYESTSAAQFSTSPAVSTVRPPSRGKSRANKRLSTLVNKAPDLFTAGYARSCQSERQPLIIEENEARKWRDHKFMYNGQLTPRNIIKMDVNTGRILMVCPNDKIPFPYFKSNINPINKHVYSQIPCCKQKKRSAHCTQKSVCHRRFV